MDAGFNCVDFRSWYRGQLNLGELEEFFFHHQRLSLRNFTEERIGDKSPCLPVNYNVSNFYHIREFCSRHNRDYHTLVNQALPLEDSLYAGNIILENPNNYIVSAVRGFGTPRTVD